MISLSIYVYYYLVPHICRVVSAKSRLMTFSISDGISLLRF